MKTRTIGLWAVLSLIVILLLLTAAGFAKPKETGKGITSVKDMEGCVMAGVTASRLPGENAEVLFETILGTKLSGYREAADIPGLLYELRSGRADVIVCPDVTAEYLLRTEEDLKRIEAPADTSNGVEGGGRLSFGMALPKGQDALRAELDAALFELEDEGMLKALQVAYVEAEEPLDLYGEENSSGKQTLYVGVTGTVPPIDMFDENGKPCGFSVALLSELEKRTGYHFETVTVETKDAFTALGSGKVDLLFAYGTGRNTTPGEKEYLMTEGYYTMQEYAYLTIK